MFSLVSYRTVLFWPVPLRGKRVISHVFLQILISLIKKSIHNFFLKCVYQHCLYTKSAGDQICFSPLCVCVCIYTYTHRPLYLVHLFNCLVTQKANQPITWQQINEFMHLDVVKTTGWSSNRASERGFKWLWTCNGFWCQTGWSEYFKNCWSTWWGFVKCEPKSSQLKEPKT